MASGKAKASSISAMWPRCIAPACACTFLLITFNLLLKQAGITNCTWLNLTEADAEALKLKVRFSDKSLLLLHKAADIIQSTWWFTALIRSILTGQWKVSQAALCNVVLPGQAPLLTSQDKKKKERKMEFLFPMLRCHGSVSGGGNIHTCISTSSCLDLLPHVWELTNLGPIQKLTLNIPKQECHNHPHKYTQSQTAAKPLLLCKFSSVKWKPINSGWGECF